MQRLFAYVGYLHSVCSLFFSFGSKDDTVVRALACHQCGPGSNPSVDTICGLSLLLVLSLAPRGFSPGTPVFPSPQNQHFQIQIRPGIDHYVDVLPPNRYLFIYLIVIFFLSLSSFYNLSIPAEYLCLITSTAVNQFAELNAV